MSAISRAASFLVDVVMGNDGAEWSDDDHMITDVEVEDLAREIANETSLSDRQSLVVAGDKLGWDDVSIALLIRRSEPTVRRIRSRIKQHGGEASGSAEESRRTGELIDDVYNDE